MGATLPAHRVYTGKHLLHQNITLSLKKTTNRTLISHNTMGATLPAHRVYTGKHLLHQNITLRLKEQQIEP